MTWDNVHQVDLAETFGGSDSGEESWGELRMTRAVPRSFELAFADLYRLAYRVAYRILGNRSDAEDVAQETLARATLRWSRLHERPRRVTKVASNLAIDRYRKLDARTRSWPDRSASSTSSTGRAGRPGGRLAQAPEAPTRGRSPALPGRFLRSRRGAGPWAAPPVRSRRTLREDSRPFGGHLGYRDDDRGGRCSSILTTPLRGIEPGRTRDGGWSARRAETSGSGIAG